MKKALEETGLFTVEVATVLPGKAKEFKPKFSDYQVVVLNYKGEEWPAETTKAFEAYVAGGGGLVVFHAVNNGFAHWKAFNEMIGVRLGPQRGGRPLHLLAGRQDRPRHDARRKRRPRRRAFLSTGRPRAGSPGDEGPAGKIPPRPR